MNNEAATTTDKQEAPINMKGMSLDKLMSKFDSKLQQEKTKAFEQKFSAKFKELDDAKAIVRNKERELEKLFLEFTENV